MNHHRKRWRVLAFLVIAILGDRLGGYLVGRVYLSTRFRFAEMFAGRLPSDLTFLGNSRGVHMFHRPPLERVTGQRVSNLSFNGMPATMLPVLFADYVDHHEPPSKIFVEVSCIGRDNEPASLERFHVLTGTSRTFDATHRRHAPTDHLACRVSHLYRYNSELLWRSVLFVRETDQDWIMTSQLSDNWESQLTPGMIRQFRPSVVDMDSLKDLLALAEEHGTQTTLILAPYFPDYFAQTRGCDAWLEWIEKETGRPVVNYATALDDQALFADPIHLNPDGADRLASLMQERGDL